jgi:hypothetical protein
MGKGGVEAGLIAGSFQGKRMHSVYALRQEGA